MSVQRTRKRSFGSPFVLGAGTVRLADAKTDAQIYLQKGTEGFRVDGTQVTVSEGHPWPQSRGKGDAGGEFTTTKSWIERDGMRNVRISNVASGSSNRQTYNGPMATTIPGPDGYAPFPPNYVSSDSQLDKLGATIIAQVAPGNPPANGATFLGELVHDGIPSLIGHTLWRDRALRARNAGDEYLNVQFGWAPLVSDVKSLAHAVSHADEVLYQYERDAGKVVRRRRNLPRVHRVEETVIASGVKATVSITGTSLLNGKSGVLSRRRETTVDTWFSGAFTYYLPRDYDSRKTLAGAASRARHLLGLDLTPDVLWELTPWSWAADWFTNTGDVIKNLRRFGTGGLVMPYAYLMEHSIIKDTYTLSETGFVGPAGGVPPLILVTETKRRRKANPFGFGVTWNGLSTFQLSILGALGLSRSR